MKTRRARHLRVVEPEPAPADLPWAKIYVGDYWRLTRGWPIEARGVLVELMLSQWAMGRLPTEPSRLRALVNVPGAVWKRTWLMVAPLFPVDGGGRRNAQLHVQRQEAAAARATAVAKGRKGAQVRWEVAQ